MLPTMHLAQQRNTCSLFQHSFELEMKWYTPLESAEFTIVLATYSDLHGLQRAYLSEWLPSSKLSNWRGIIFAYYPQHTSIALLLVGMLFDRQVPSIQVSAPLPAHLWGIMWRWRLYIKSQQWILNSVYLCVFVFVCSESEDVWCKNNESLLTERVCVSRCACLWVCARTWVFVMSERFWCPRWLGLSVWMRTERAPVTVLWIRSPPVAR